jgi:hypothetical protein
MFPQSVCNRGSTRQSGLSLSVPSAAEMLSSQLPTGGVSPTSPCGTRQVSRPVPHLTGQPTVTLPDESLSNAADHGTRLQPRVATVGNVTHDLLTWQQQEPSMLDDSKAQSKLAHPVRSQLSTYISYYCVYTTT